MRKPNTMPLKFLTPALIFLLCGCFKDPPSSELPPDPDPPDGDPVEIIHRKLTEDLQFPWELVWGPDDMIWMTERTGKLSRVDPATGQVHLVTSISEVVAQGEGGLMGMALHPQFDQTPYVYLSYNYNKSGSYTVKVVRFTYNGGTLNDPLTLVDDISGANIHDGSRLVISAGNKLFITTGDAANQSLPQNFSSKNGKVLRINLDGSIPSDNPDPSSPVWSLGHRNAQGLVFVGDSLFSSEHGPDTDDEVNMIHRGGNYGWPDVRGNCDPAEQDFCDEWNVVEPLMRWTPTIAACGIDYYTNDLIPQWKNSILMCTLKNSRLVQLKLNEDRSDIASTSDFFADVYGRMRDLCVSPDGKVYICTSNGGNNDMIIEVTKK